jgi:hypothetical protein
VVLEDEEDQLDRLYGKRKVLHRVTEERNILHTIKQRKANWIGHIFHRNHLLKHIIEGKIKNRIEMTGRPRRKCKQRLDEPQEMRRYWKLKEEVIHSWLRSNWEEVMDLSYDRLWN